ncbi:MAG: Beta-glucanase [Porticoccaceae bacterium UBA1117]|nr:MAG: Beta-glucanase [Porticoccaceae bacterium UBA1117]
MNFYQYFTTRSGFFFLAFFTLTLLSVVVSSSSDPDGNASSYSIMSSPALASGDWDIDGDGRADALTDGLLFLRYAFGLTGDALISGVVASDAQYTTASDIEQELATVYTSSGDIDGNGEVDALTDGLLLLRYLFGLDGDTLTAGVIGGGATLTDSATLQTYLSTLMPQAPYITLNGSATINHEQATSYVDAGATATDVIDESVTVTITGSVDSDTAGVYSLSYSATDSEGNVSRILIRTVTVADTIAPVITLVGDDAVEVKLDSTYTDAGASATDTVDGSVDVITTGSVDTSAAGAYTFTYTATDKAGNKASQTRIVTVAVSSSLEVTNVFVNGEVDASWEGGIKVADSTKNWSDCDTNDISECNIEWKLVNDQERGTVLQIEHSSSSNQAILYFKTNNAQNLTLYAGGQIKFDLKTLSGDSNYSMKIDCIWDCTSGDQVIGSIGSDGWESVTIEVDDLVDTGLQLTTIDTGLVIWATQYTNTVFQIDNVRWEDTDGGGTTVEEPLADDGWVIPSFTGYESPSTYEGYRLTWSDEFSGTEINDDNWGYDIGGSGWGNNELQYHTNRNAYLKEGLLVIRAQQEAYRGKNYTSSRLKTQGKQNFKYGRIDVRARLPEGAGIWPALWMLGENITDVGWPKSGEIDIMEMVGGNSPQDKHPNGDRTAHGTMHWNNNGLNGSYSPVNTGKSEILSTSLSEEFHVFSIQWDVNGIGWYIDDAQYSYKTINSTQPFREEFFFIMNIAVGGDWPGSPNSSTVFPQRMVIDYVRVFQKN